jgi:hypothetical protein
MITTPFLMWNGIRFPDLARCLDSPGMNPHEGASMRFVLTAVLALAMSLCAFAEGDGKDAVAPPVAPAATDAKAVNDVCACGKPVDPKIAPVAATTKEGKKVLIGTCSESCNKKVAEHPEKFVDAAVANKSMKDEKKEEKAEKKAEKKEEHDHK